MERGLWNPDSPDNGVPIEKDLGKMEAGCSYRKFAEDFGSPDPPNGTL